MDNSVNFPFTVICMNNLNLNLNNRLPIRQELSKDLNFLFTKQGILHMAIDVPMTGFVPGQQVPVKCQVTNKSKTKITSVSFCIERIVTYTAQNPRTKCCQDRQKFVEYIGKGLDKMEDELFLVNLVLPGIPPSSTIDCIISFQYFLKVRANVSGMHGNLKIHIPIQIGNVPVTSPEYTEAKTSHMFDPSCPSYKDLMGLPTYEESQMSAIMTETDPDDEDGKLAFHPQYPIYQNRYH